MAMFDKRSPANPLASRQPSPPVRQPQPMAPAVTPPPFLRDTEVRTSIGADAVITGKLSFTTPTRVEGKLKGELRCTQLLIISASAVIEGWVKADELRVEGIVRGEVAETRKVEICAQGRLIGKIATHVLVLREGGFFEGQCGPYTEESRSGDLELEGESPPTPR